MARHRRSKMLPMGLLGAGIIASFARGDHAHRWPSWLPAFLGQSAKHLERTACPPLLAESVSNAMPSYTHKAGSSPLDKWGGLSNADCRRIGGGAEQLGQFLYELAQLAPVRYFVNGLSMIETTVDMRAGRAEVSVTTTPQGKTVLALSAKDSSFKIKLDADAITEVVLEDEEETGRCAAHVVDAKGRKHLSALMQGADSFGHYQVLRGRWSTSVKLKG
eukprot:TRINITY_DN109747_c0_g1_i1.p1 TRINITY_DN109747_c0_g1~~TRINITY_DN109747_c0_g1_i1.p1  ORF type:complete len:219 (-),score=29.69 TRINITY_DN109747_c0_g1_i1:122-778(-)